MMTLYVRHFRSGTYEIPGHLIFVGYWVPWIRDIYSPTVTGCMWFTESPYPKYECNLLGSVLEYVEDEGLIDGLTCRWKFSGHLERRACYCTTIASAQWLCVVPHRWETKAICDQSCIT
jgi:hypothetical protein